MVVWGYKLMVNRLFFLFGYADEIFVYGLWTCIKSYWSGVLASLISGFLIIGILKLSGLFSSIISVYDKNSLNILFALACSFFLGGS